MQFRLRTLWAIITLVAVVAAAFGLNVLLGIFAYLACLSLFMVTWRIRVVCREADAYPKAYEDKWIPARILLANAGIGLLAAVAFCGGCTITQVSVGPPLLVPEDRMAEALAEFNRGLLLSIPVGTAAALGFYWFSWPLGEE